MNPSFFVGKVAGTRTLGFGTFTFDLSAIATKPGDTLVAIFVTFNDGFTHRIEDDAWAQDAFLTHANAQVVVGRRTVVEGDESAITLDLDWAPPWAAAVVHVYRNLDPGAAVVASAIAGITTTTLFACPSLTLATFSDVYIGIVGVTSATTAVTPPAGATERHEAAADAGTRTLETFDLWPEATGATGTKTATTGANQSGVAASVAFAAVPLETIDKAIRLDPKGTIGLPAVGV